MNASQIEKNVSELVKLIDKENFIFDLLIAYGISKTSITRLKKGDFNLSKIEGEVLYKKKVFFKEVASDKLLTTIDDLTKNEEDLKHNPRFVIVTDYITLLAKDIRTGLTLDTPITEINKRFDFFLPWAGQEKYQSKNENHADRKASYEMAKLYDILVHENPNIYDDGGHNLNIFLSRLLFCFFAEDTGIFNEEGVFTNTLGQHTKSDGSDVHLFLDRLFKVLNTEDNSDEPAYLQVFPYVNGGLFGSNIVSPKFSSKARKIILECGGLDWSEINPDIFGSMIQAVVNPEYRSGLGMHYTSVPNIMKVIEPLFLNELREEFEKSKGKPSQLRKLIYRISKIKCFDPACGSGNFLIIAYKELRQLEIEILQDIYNTESQVSIVFTEVKLSQFYGIELDDFAHEMAILSLWLAEHQMNKVFVDELHDYGKAKPILPLKDAGHITQGNATRLDWVKVCPISKNDEVYILGNPPYLGSRNQDTEQKEDMRFVFRKDYKSLDYVSCWFYLGAKYIEGFNAQIALVSTNSICQGEQVAITWPRILNDKIEIGFAYQSFKWTNNAKGNAGVTVIIVGLRNITNKVKYLFDHGLMKEATNISPYLTNSKSIYIKRTSSPISNLPVAVFGNMPNDGGNLLLNEIEKEELISAYPQTTKYIKEFIGAHDFTTGKKRWCLLIADRELEEAMKIDILSKRLDNVRKIREKSTEVSTREKANTPNQFYFFSHQDTDSILIPRHTSERRDYIPVGFFDSKTVIADSALAIYNAQPWIFGLLNSKIHMSWVRGVGGKLKTDYRYSTGLCFNTFPFPKITDKQKEQINLHVFDVLDERAKYPEKTLAQLYDPDKMPKGLREAHYQLDLAIERCYRLKPFESDVERLEYLFKMYEEMTTKNSLAIKEKKTKKVK
ncbi:class I SAM-dependent DNA methyltransferase [Flavobacterium tructae]|uniref:site-specific DNA-methyltransferase (adenine-specific) n=1 Tax=Flavobacterium tructae TaxID=1114873 RepID=A0A1S1J901_9FLAO|nr:DNA methyltransferase [Flavobacterium tructae]OHT45626.1 DNA methyltransferase [Flavobacterium tructae]OXB18284.1 SAM-dependent methyltransferase [Flavobacterium tructae]